MEEVLVECGFSDGILVGSRRDFFLESDGGGAVERSVSAVKRSVFAADVLLVPATLPSTSESTLLSRGFLSHHIP